ncbi:ADP-ribosylation factor GTPase-activating protein [Actinidia chinensis var. chinensis]|uniref:ADP-ribosylation factor GTPase-activating protein n=1 Tax=Actinidia chinensis var. chinensis TaxID=1590841 RepID=A0A2R6QRI6_ACTCC|nr:ADP-ribosylation factor GTPase-activating protein [Actinidia chinensis var. chinensis]
MHFTKLDDSPMFRKQIQCLEESAEFLRERSLKFYKGCRKYTEGLGEGYDGDIAFASALESFGGGHNDPISVAFGGPVMTKFTIALREIGTYKEVLRSQVEHMLNDRLLQFANIDLHDVKSEGLGEGYDGDIAFASALESFGGGHNDPISVAFGGPVMTKFTIALREIGTYKEVLRSQVEHMLNDRLLQFANIDLHDVKEARKRFDKASLLYDQVILISDSFLSIPGQMHCMLQARERFLSLRKGTKSDIATVLEEELHHARSSFEQARFNLVTALSNVEAKKRFEFLEAVSGTMDAHLRYFKQGYELLHQMEPYINQAESTLDQMDWIEKITGVIASLLSSQAPERCLLASPMGNSHHRSASESSSFESSDFDNAAVEEYTSERLVCGHHERTSRSSQQLRPYIKSEKPIDVLRKVCGNDRCADCGAPEPDWASLNLGVLVCIECSGVHRNLGVHISKVRSLTLDVKVWEPSVISLFQSLGNTFANSVWEEQLQLKSGFKVDLDPTSLYKSDKPQLLLIGKPSHTDSISVKEKFIHAKYADKCFVRKTKDNRTVAQQIWEAVCINDKKAVYQLIVNSEADVNAVYGQGSCKSLTLAKVMLLQEQTSLDHNSRFLVADSPAKYLNSLHLGGTSEGHAMEDIEGCSLLHLACETADIGMLELLLQYGANINASDSRGQTPLHRCILGGKATFVRLLLTRGADPQGVHGEGKTPIELALESKFEDSEVLALLSDSNG